MIRRLSFISCFIRLSLPLTLFFMCLSFSAGASAGVYSHQRKPVTTVPLHYVAAYAPDELLIRFKETTTKRRAVFLRQKFQARTLHRLKSIAVEHWKLPAGSDLEATLKMLKNNPTVKYAEPNYRRYPRATPNDPFFSNQWGLQNTGQMLPGFSTGIVGADMDLPTAWNTTTGSRNVVVAIVDDSVDINHPDLQANIWQNSGETPNDGIDNDGNGFIDDVHGWDFVNNDNDPSADPGFGEGHGSSVAGCVGAVGNNATGVTGVNWAVSIMGLKMGFDIVSVIQALQYAQQNGAHIVNASYGGPGFSQAEFDAIQSLANSGVLFVAAAGNYEGNNDITPDAPSSYDLPNVIAVGASGPDDGLLTWSHWGATSVDLIAPGEHIFTATPLSNFSSTPGYHFIDGTSFSSPYVAGIAALVKAAFPTATFQEMKGRIFAGATPMVKLQGKVATSARASATGALTAIPTPQMLIRKFQWVDGGNGFPDPGETANVLINLENNWLDATGVSATLSSLGNNATIVVATATYPDIAGGSNADPVSTFSISIPQNMTGYQIYRFRLDITAVGGYATSRYYELRSGTLQNGVMLNESIQTDAQDDFRLYHIDIPAGATNLTISTSSSSVDVDMLISPHQPPLFDFNGYWMGPMEPGIIVAANIGNESHTITAPQAATYYIMVLNYDNQITTAAPFSVSASYTPGVEHTPVVSAPTNILLRTNNIAASIPSTQTQITVFLNSATALDIEDGALVNIQNNAPAFFLPGVTRVTFSVADSAGNTGTAEAAVMVKVVSSTQVQTPLAKNIHTTSEYVVPFMFSGSGIVMASDLMAATGVNASLQKWDVSLQQRVSQSVLNDFALRVGDVYFVSVSGDSNVNLTGILPMNQTFSLVKNFATTSENLLFLYPGMKAAHTITDSTSLIDAIKVKMNGISKNVSLQKWDPALQQRISASGLNVFTIHEGEGYFISASEGVNWP
ncbi:MAG: S8 family serine peptidase [Mariprofundaceae bacterium]